MKKIASFFVLFFTFSSFVFAQKDNNINILKEHREAALGTYQFIYHPSKLQYVFTTETLVEIENRRDAKVTKYIWVAPTVEVMILPNIIIEDPKFIPIADRINVND